MDLTLLSLSIKVFEFKFEFCLFDKGQNAIGKVINSISPSTPGPDHTAFFISSSLFHVLEEAMSLYTCKL